MTQFAQELTEEDHCTVVCVLTHQQDGYLYGSDGNKTTMAELLQPLSDQKCPAIAGKPKITFLFGNSESVII